MEEEWAHLVYWMYGIVLSDSVTMNAEEFTNALRPKRVETRPFFLGMHEQPVFQKRGLFLGEKYAVTEWPARRDLCLPSGLALTEEQMKQVCDAVQEILA